MANSQPQRAQVFTPARYGGPASTVKAHVSGPTPWAPGSLPGVSPRLEQGGRFSPRGPTRPLPLWTSPQLSPRPAVVASVTVVSGFRDVFPAPGNVAAKRCASEKRAF